MTYNWSKCFSEIFEIYCNNTTLNGWKYFVEKRRTTAEKLLWCLIQLIAISSGIYFSYIISGSFWTTPTIITLENPNYHIHNVPFPAVAVCDVNRISLKKAQEYVNQRARFYNVTVSKLMNFTKYIGRFYDYDDENLDILHEFNSIIEKRYNLEFNSFNFTNFMLKMTPTFNDTLLKCFWKSQEVKCSDIFSFRRTMDGFCATFNYEKSKDHVFIRKQGNQVNPNIDTNYSDSTGIDMGLTILVRSNVSDYFYPLTQMEGLKILIYNKHDYPDLTSGGLVESLVPLNFEVFMQIDPITVEAVDILKNYPKEQRQCMFGDESTTAFDSKHYSYSDCLTECRMKSILALCECVPFYMAISNKLSYAKQICTIADIPCLNKYKEKWNTMSPADDNLESFHELAKEMHNSLKCPQCYRDCSFTNYRIFNEYAPLMANNPFLKEYNMSEISLVHIYFDSETTFLYKNDLMYYWYDIVSNFGGMCGVFVGFGIVSVIEFFYFFIFKYIVLLIKTKNEN